MFELDHELHEALLVGTAIYLILSGRDEPNCLLGLIHCMPELQR